MKQRYETTTQNETIPAPARRFSLPQSEKARERRRIVGVGLIGGVALTGALLGLNHLSNEARAGGDASNELLNPDVTAVQIEDGAIVRSDPRLRDDEATSNRLGTLDLGDARHVIVPTEEGVRIAHDKNGAWFGLSAEQLTDVIDIDVSADRDGIVWINEQRAQPSGESAEK